MYINYAIMSMKLCNTVHQIIIGPLHWTRRNSDRSTHNIHVGLRKRLLYLIMTEGIMCERLTMAWVDHDYSRITMSSRLLPSLFCNDVQSGILDMTYSVNIFIGLYSRISSKGPPIGNGMWAMKWSRDRWRHVTLKGQTRDPNTLRAQ